MIGRPSRLSVRAWLAALLLASGQALAQAPSQIPAQAQTPGQGTPDIPAQATAPANPPDAPVPRVPQFPPPSLPQAERLPAQGAGQTTRDAAGRPTPPTGISAGAPVPNADVLVMLVRSSLAAFNQANQTNNYSVLHALAAPAFQRDNDVAKLAASFTSFRERKVDLAPVAVLAPRFLRPAEIDGQGLLRVTGAFPSRPLQVIFNIVYQSVEGSWRFVALAVDASPATADAGPSAPATAMPSIATTPASAAKPAPDRVTKHAHRAARRTASSVTTTHPPAKVSRSTFTAEKVRRHVTVSRRPVRGHGRQTWNWRGDPPLTTNYR